MAPTRIPSPWQQVEPTGESLGSSKRHRSSEVARSPARLRGNPSPWECQSPRPELSRVSRGHGWRQAGLNDLPHSVEVGRPARQSTCREQPWMNSGDEGLNIIARLLQGDMANAHPDLATRQAALDADLLNLHPPPPRGQRDNPVQTLLRRLVQGINDTRTQMIATIDDNGRLAAENARLTVDFQTSHDMVTEMVRQGAGAHQRVEPFSKLDPAAWRIYKARFVNLAATRGWPDDRSKGELFMAMREDAARTVEDYDHRPVGITLQDMLDEYEHRFNPAINTDVARLEWASCTMEADETIQLWHTRCRSIFRRAFPLIGAAAAQGDFTLIKTFAERIRDRMVSIQVQRSIIATTTYDEVLVTACKELFLDSGPPPVAHGARDRRGLMHMDEPAAGVENSAIRQIDGTMDQEDAAGIPMDEGELNALARGLGELSALARGFPHRHEVALQPLSRNHASATSCNYCGRPNHTESVCFHKKNEKLRLARLRQDRRSMLGKGDKPEGAMDKKTGEAKPRKFFRKSKVVGGQKMKLKAKNA